MLSCQIFGKGKPVLFLHAFPLSSAMWEPQIRFFENKYRLIVPDLPGFGKSESEPGMTMTIMAEQTAILLKEKGFEEPVFIVGLSMGGYVAFEFLRMFQKQAAGLALCSTRATPDTETARENRFKSIESIQTFGVEPFARKAVKSQLGASTQSEYPEMIQEVLSMMKRTPPEGAIEAQKAMASRRDNSDILSKINFPVLVLVGEEDTLSPPAEMEAMHKKIPGSVFQTIPKAGHLINLEQPEIFNRALADFLAVSSQRAAGNLKE